MRSRRILALMLAAVMLIGQMQTGYAAELRTETQEESEIESETKSETATELSEEITAQKSDAEEVPETTYLEITETSEEITVDLDHEPKEETAPALDEETSEWKGSFGAQLSGTAAECYEKLKQIFITDGYEAEEPVAPLTATFSLETSDTFTATVVKKDGVNVMEQDNQFKAAVSEVEQAVRQAYLALYNDYPELYWSYGYSIESAVGATRSEDGTWMGAVRSVTLRITQQYYDNCSTGETGDATLLAYQAEVSRIVDEAEENTNGTDYELAKYFHDYLCNTIAYDSASIASGALYSHTSVPALIGYGEDGDKKVVCEGYAKAFKVLCDKAEIPCVLVSGQGGTGDKEAHMWNYVQMDDEQWYLVDATWDDQGDDTPRETYFMGGSTSEGFSNTRVGESHKPVALTDVSEQELGITFVYPTLAETSYQYVPIVSLSRAYRRGRVEIDYASRYTWTGEAVDMVPYSVLVDGEELLPGRDYRISYEAADGTLLDYAKDVGAYTLVLEGIGGYKDSIRLEVEITNDYALSDMTVGDVAVQTYTGTELCPGVKLINPKTKAVLKEGTHYTVRYEDNINAGTAVMTVDAIEGKGYTGRIRIPFTIEPRDVSQLSILGISSSYNYTGSPITPVPTLKLGDTTLTEAVDYELSYEANQNTGTAKLIITGLGNYTGTATTTFSISKTNMDQVDIDLDLTNVSAGKSPAVQVTWSGSVLKEKTDYTVTYSKSTDQRTGTVIIRGKGNYTGEVKRNYAIPRLTIREENITFAKTWYYTGKLIAAAPTKIIVNGKQLNRGVDYTLHYEDSNGNDTMQVREAGEYFLVVEGQKNYQGTVKLSFKVTKDRLLGRMNVSSVKDQTYTGQPLTPEISVTDSGEDLLSRLLEWKGTKLTEGTHYTVGYENNTDAGTASIHLTAVEGSGYAGERTIYFRILPRNIDDTSVSVSLPQNGKINYDGTPCTLEPTITMTTTTGNGQTGTVQTLGEGTDYTVVWYNNDQITDKAYMVITGLGNYTGSRIVRFTIVENTLTPEVTCKLDPSTYTYTGAAICPELTLTNASTGQNLAEGTDYRVSYEKNIDAGEASVIVYGITGSGYSGMYTQKFTIAPKAINADDITVTLENSASDAAEPLRATVMDGGKILEKGTDYTISYTKTDDQITAVITGQGNYSGTRTETLQRIQLDENEQIDCILEYYETLYTGSYLTPVTSVKLNGRLLQAGVDYTVTYTNNRDASTDDTPATVTIQGRGAYTGSLTRTFEIKQVDINRASVGSVSTCTYWQVANAGVNLTYRGKHLQVNRDYTVSYDNEIRIGTNKVTLTGTGNYKGQIVLDLNVTYPASDKLQLTGCTMTAYDENAGTVTIQMTAADDGKFANFMDATQIYIQVPGADGQNVWEKATIDAGTKTLTATFPADEHRRSNVMSRYVLAVPAENSTGYQQITSNSMYVDNPGEYAETDKTYYGFYQGKVDSKKGMQGVEETDTKDLGVNAVLLNINLNELIKTSTNVRKYGAKTYQPYTYKGKTYYFHDMVAYRHTVFELNRRLGTAYKNEHGDDTKYGDWTKNVTVDLLMKWDPELQYLIYPAGRVAGKNDYALNMSDATARATLEALFSYITEALGGTKGTDEGGWYEGDGSKSPYCFRVSNWVLGNEVNACKAWNYAGNVSTQECADNYARAFQVLYQAVKKSDKNARVFISLDHTWTARTGDGHPGKEYLDRFAYYMHATEPQMEWNVDYHPYSNPLYRNDFWNDWSSTSGSEYTSYISMNNLSVLTNYLKKLEERYGIKNTDEDGDPDPTGGIRVILGEQGYIAAGPGQEASQAAATAYEFYLASANTKVDAIMNRAYLDDSAEGIMTLGLRYNRGAKNHPAKQAYSVVKHMDDPDALTNETVNSYAHYVKSGASDWTEVLSGLTQATFYRE